MGLWRPESWGSSQAHDICRRKVENKQLLMTQSRAIPYPTAIRRVNPAERVCGTIMRTHAVAKLVKKNYDTR